MWKQKWNYLKDGWNINDLCFLMVYFSAIFCDWQLGTNQDDDSYGEVTRVLYSILVITAFIKWLNSSKIFGWFDLIIKMLI